jgi:hypothetical protein
MLGHMILFVAVIGQTAVGVPQTGSVPSEQEKKARALAERQAKKDAIEARIIANYQLENDRLRERLQTMDVVTNRNWSLTAGTSQVYRFDTGEGLMSVPATGTPIAPERLDSTSLERLRRENWLLKGRLRDRRSVYREVNRLYMAEYPIRYQAASRGVLH